MCRVSTTPQPEQPQEHAGIAAFAREFARAAVQPALPPLLGALAIVIALFTIAITTITPTFMARIDPGMLMTDERDEFGFLTAYAFHLRHDPPKSPTVVLVGASGFQHAIPSAKVMSEMLSEKLGRPARVSNMTIGGCTLWESASIIDFLDDRVQGVYVVNVSMSKLGWPDSRMEFLSQSPRLGFSTELFDEEVREAGYRPSSRTGIYALDNFKFLLARLKSLRNIVIGPVKISRYSPTAHVVSEDEWPEHIEEYLPFLRDYEEHNKARYASLSRLIEHVRANRSEIALVQAPMNPRMTRAIPDELKQRYQQELEAFADDHDVPLWELDAEAHLTEDDFRDRSHINSPEARRRFADALTNRLSQLLRHRLGESEVRQ